MLCEINFAGLVCLLYQITTVRRIRTLPCAEHFRILAFAQLTYRESLRGIEACLSAQAAKLYHMGIRSPVKRATLADANERRDWRIYAEFAQRLITQARKLYAAEDLGLDLSNTVYALDATTICALYNARWQVELFFKWIKQHLRIKRFYGTSENAVKTQIWTAVSVYVLVAIVKKRLHLDISLYTLLQILSVTLFEKMPLNKGFLDVKYSSENDVHLNQLNLFDS